MGRPAGRQAGRHGAQDPGSLGAEDGARPARSSPAADPAVAILYCERARRRLRKLGCGVARFPLVTLRGEAAARARPAAIGRGPAEGGAGFARISQPLLTAADGRGPGSRQRSAAAQSRKVARGRCGWLWCGTREGVVWGVGFQFERLKEAPWRPCLLALVNVFRLHVCLTA